MQEDNPALPRLALLLLLSAPAFADTATTIDGLRYDGTIVSITTESVIVREGRHQVTLKRAFVRELLFEQSDLISVASGETICGRVMHREEEGLVVGVVTGLRTIPDNEGPAIRYTEGPPIRLALITWTDDVFHPSASPVRTRRSMLFGSLFLGWQNMTYTSSSPTKTIPGTAFGFDIGLEITPLWALTFQAYHLDGRTGLERETGSAQPKNVGASVAGASVRFTIPTKVAVQPYLHLSALVAYATSSFGDGDAKAMVIPAVGLSVPTSAPIHLFCEAGFGGGAFDLNRRGRSVETSPLSLTAGLRLYLVITEE